MSKELKPTKEEFVKTITAFGIANMDAGEDKPNNCQELWNKLNQQINLIYQPDPMLSECLGMLSTCLAYWKGDADKEEMYEVKEKYGDLIARLQKGVIK